MPMLPHQTETRTARMELHNAVQAYSRSPTVPNEKRVHAAMKRWREIKALRDLPQAPQEFSNETPVTHPLRSAS